MTGRGNCDRGVREGVEARVVTRVRKVCSKQCCVLSFLYACPEPVLVKRSVLNEAWTARPSSYRPFRHCTQAQLEPRSSLVAEHPSAPPPPACNPKTAFELPAGLSVPSLSWQMMPLLALLVRGNLAAVQKAVCCFPACAPTVLRSAPDQACRSTVNRSLQNVNKTPCRLKLRCVLSRAWLGNLSVSSKEHLNAFHEKSVSFRRTDDVDVGRAGGDVVRRENPCMHRLIHHQKPRICL